MLSNTSSFPWYYHLSSSFRIFGKPYVVPFDKSEGGHGGGDPVLLKDVLGGEGREDEFKRAAFIRDGGNAVLVGVGANISMETGQPVRVQELVQY